MLHQKLTTNSINDTTSNIEAAVASAVNRYLTATIKNNQKLTTANVQQQQQRQQQNEENIISIDGKSSRSLLNSV